MQAELKSIQTFPPTLAKLGPSWDLTKPEEEEEEEKKDGSW